MDRIKKAVENLKSEVKKVEEVVENLPKLVDGLGAIGMGIVGFPNGVQQKLVRLEGYESGIRRALQELDHPLQEMEKRVWRTEEKLERSILLDPEGRGVEFSEARKEKFFSPELLWDLLTHVLERLNNPLYENGRWCTCTPEFLAAVKTAQQTLLAVPRSEITCSYEQVMQQEDEEE